MSLCAACSLAWNKWLDYRLPPPPIQLLVIGNRPQDIAERTEARYRQWRDTVRFQQDLIVQICTEKHQAPEERCATTPPPPTIRP